jgi:DNA-binding MarR family transcriptional regulator
MPTSKQFTDAVRSWTEVSIQRSMHDFGRFMHAAGLSMPQVNTLMRLYHKTTCGVSGIGRDLGISSAAASQMVDRMVQQGLLARTESPGDRRVRELSLTAKGRALVEQAIDARHSWLAALPAKLTREQQAAAVACLTSLTAAARLLEAARPAPPSPPSPPRKRGSRPAVAAPKHS